MVAGRATGATVAGEGEGEGEGDGDGDTAGGDAETSARGGREAAPDQADRQDAGEAAPPHAAYGLLAPASLRASTERTAATMTAASTTFTARPMMSAWCAVSAK